MKHLVTRLRANTDGVTKALDFNIRGMLAVLMGALTGVGGGTLRDLMLAWVPNVLKADIYAVAAIVGATVIVLGLKVQWPRTRVMALGARRALCCGWWRCGST